MINSINTTSKFKNILKSLIIIKFNIEISPNNLTNISNIYELVANIKVIAKGNVNIIAI